MLRCLVSICARVCVCPVVYVSITTLLNCIYTSILQGVVCAAFRQEPSTLSVVGALVGNRANQSSIDSHVTELTLAPVVSASVMLSVVRKRRIHKCELSSFGDGTSHRN